MKSSNNVIAWAMRNFRITFLIIGCLSLFGIYALARIPKQEFPEYTIRQGVVVGLYPGATSEEVEQQLAKPLEQFLMTYKEVKRHKTTSTSQNGMCYVMVELNDDVNNKDEVWSKIKHGLVSFKAQLPAGVVALVAAITIPPVDVHLHRGDVSVRHPAQHGDAGRSDRRAGNDRRQLDRRHRRLPSPTPSTGCCVPTIG